MKKTKHEVSDKSKAGISRNLIRRDTSCFTQRHFKHSRRTRLGIEMIRAARKLKETTD